MWKEVSDILLGEMSAAYFVAYFIVMSLGAILFFAGDVTHSTHANGSTPGKFSWKFLLRDNVLRFITVAISLAASVLLYEDLYGVELNVKLAFTHGLTIDAFLGTMLKVGKDRGPLKKQREKLLNKYK